MVDARVTVVIVNYHSVEHLGRCLAGLSSPRIHRIVVADNASGNEEVQALEVLAVRDDRVVLLCNEANLGFGPAVNRAVDAVTWKPDDHVWILNPDTEPEPDSVDALLAVLADGTADLVAPLMTTGSKDEPMVWFAGGSADPLVGEVSHAYFGDPVDAVPPGVLAAGFLTGAAPLMRHETWALLGGFREDLFLYWEDVDLSLRARRLGLRMACATDARVWHLRGGSSGSDVGKSPSFYYYCQRNRILVCRAEAGLARLVAGRGAMQVLRLLAKPVLVEPGGRMRKLYASVRGVTDGIRGVTGPCEPRRPSAPRMRVGV